MDLSFLESVTSEIPAMCNRPGIKSGPWHHPTWFTAALLPYIPQYPLVIVSPKMQELPGINRAATLTDTHKLNQNVCIQTDRNVVMSLGLF